VKRKITYVLLTILLLAGLCYGLNSVFGLFTSYNFWTARQDIKNGKIQIAEIGEMPLNFDQKQKLANSYGFDFRLFGCEVTSGVINGTKYYNNVMVGYLESKYGVGWWTKFKTQLDSIDAATRDRQKQVTKRLSFKSVSDIVADSSYGVWVEKHDSSFSLALHFQDKDILAVSYSPECWLMFPYKLESNKIVVYWDNNIDTKYDFDIVKAINKTDKKYIGKPFMTLELINDTTLKANYLMKELISKINSSSRERTFFPDKYTVVQEGDLYD
jgi:hypothetical protein